MPESSEPLLQRTESAEDQVLSNGQAPLSPEADADRQSGRTFLQRSVFERESLDELLRIINTAEPTQPNLPAKENP